jgi:hypothetical protein
LSALSHFHGVIGRGILGRVDLRFVGRRWRCFVLKDGDFLGWLYRFWNGQWYGFNFGILAMQRERRVDGSAVRLYWFRGQRDAGWGPRKFYIHGATFSAADAAPLITWKFYINGENDPDDEQSVKDKRVDEKLFEFEIFVGEPEAFERIGDGGAHFS